jgi:hypothetical protein
MLETSRRVAVADDAGRAATRKGCDPAHSMRAIYVVQKSILHDSHRCVRGETHTSWHRMHTATGREEELETEPTARDGTLRFGRTSHGEATDG